MNEWLTDGAVVVFEPDAGWGWEGWDGRVAVAVPAVALRAEGRPVAVAADLVRLGLRLVARAYKAVGFDDTPGLCLSARVRVDEATLAEVVRLGRRRIATTGTRGTFRLACQPSLQKGPPPVPDPLAAARGGSWRVVQPGGRGARSR